MQTETIYYSKKEAIYTMLKTLGGMAFGIYWIVNHTIDRQLYLGVFALVISVVFCLYTYIKKYKNQEAIVEFSDQGIKTEDEFLEWKFIKRISLQEKSDDNKSLELLIEYTDDLTLEIYEDEKKDIESGAYQIRIEEEYKQSLGIKSYEPADMEQEVSPRFEVPAGLTPPEVITEAEMFYDETIVSFIDADQTEEQIRAIISDFKKKVNKSLPKATPE